MTVKQQIPLWLGVIAFAAVLCYGIASLILPHPVENKENNAEIAIGKTLPPAYFFDGKREKKAVGDFGGNVVLVNLWATWCTPCVAELPALDSLQKKLGGKKFRVVAISLDRSSKNNGALARNFLSDRKLSNLHPYWDRDRQIPENWPYDGLPTSFLLDKEGVLLEIFKGPVEWDKPEMVKKVGEMAGE